MLQQKSQFSKTGIKKLLRYWHLCRNIQMKIFTVFKLIISILFKSCVVASYDSMSSVPTPDMSMDVHSSVTVDPQPVNPPRVIPTPRPMPIYSSTDDPFLSPTAHKQVYRRTYCLLMPPTFNNKIIFYLCATCLVIMHKPINVCQTYHFKYFFAMICVI